MNYKLVFLKFVCLLVFLIIFQVENSCAQRLSTYQLNIGSANATLPQGKKWDITAILPVGPTHNLIIGHALTDKIAVYGSVQNDFHSRKISENSGTGSNEFDFKINAQAFQAMIGYTILPVKYLPKDRQAAHSDKNVRLAIDFRVGIGTDRIASSIFFEGDKIANSKVNYHTAEACLNTVLVARKVHFKVSNRFLISEYQKIKITGPNYNNERNLNVLNEFRNRSVYSTHLLEFSLQTNFNKFGFIVGAMLSNSYSISLSDFLHYNGMAYIGANYKF